MIKANDFEVNGGLQIIDGKCHWPDSLNLSMPDFHAWELVHSLIAQLREGEKVVRYSFCGKLDYDVDESA